MISSLSESLSTPLSGPNRVWVVIGIAAITVASVFFISAMIIKFVSDRQERALRRQEIDAEKARISTRPDHQQDLRVVSVLPSDPIHGTPSFSKTSIEESLFVGEVDDRGAEQDHKPPSETWDHQWERRYWEAFKVLENFEKQRNEWRDMWWVQGTEHVAAQARLQHTIVQQRVGIIRLVNTVNLLRKEKSEQLGKEFVPVKHPSDCEPLDSRPVGEASAYYGRMKKLLEGIPDQLTAAQCQGDLAARLADEAETGIVSPIHAASNGSLDFLGAAISAALARGPGPTTLDQWGPPFTAMVLEKLKKRRAESPGPTAAINEAIAKVESHLNDRVKRSQGDSEALGVVRGIGDLKAHDGAK